jgi:hypothetical protein
VVLPVHRWRPLYEDSRELAAAGADRHILRNRPRHEGLGGWPLIAA